MLLIKKNDLTVETLESNAKQREEDLVEQLADFEEKERDLSLTVEELLQKNSILSDLLEFVTASRNAELESEDKEQESKNSQSAMKPSDSSVSALSGVSAGSDDVFAQERRSSEPLSSSTKKGDWNVSYRAPRRIPTFIHSFS